MSDFLTKGPQTDDVADELAAMIKQTDCWIVSASGAENDLIRALADALAVHRTFLSTQHRTIDHQDKLIKDLLSRLKDFGVVITPEPPVVN